MEGSPSSSAAPLRYPAGALFILGGYLTERFVYYGLVGGSVFYMQRVLHFSATESSAIKSIMEGLIYLAPILGAVLADAYFGKFRLVVSMCCCYVVGAMLFSLSSATPLMTSVTGTKATGIAGFLIFGLAAGTMKAVYSSLGPDQFILPEQRALQKRFFYFFYWMINAGAFCGQLLTAQLRDTVQCFGGDCYLLPFCLLVGLMAVSTVIFYSGKRRYRDAPVESYLGRAIGCAVRAVKMRFTTQGKAPVEHWVDRAALPGQGAVTDQTLLSDVKQTCGVLLLFTTWPLFWALFYQTSTGMIFQAKRLNDRVGSYRIPPELTSSINPLLILLLIPLFDLVIYPLFDRLKVFTETTTRMTAGMFLAVVAFIIYGFLNMQVEQSILGGEEARLQVYNTLPCPASIILHRPNHPDHLESPQRLYTTIPALDQVALNGDTLRLWGPQETVTLIISNTCHQHDTQTTVNVTLLEKHQSTVLLDMDSSAVLEPTLHYIKDADAEAKVRLTSLYEAHATTIEEFVLNYHEMNISIVVAHGLSEFTTVSPQPYKIINVKTDQVLGDIDIRQDGVYDIVLSQSTNITTFALTAPSNIHVLWSIPQYLVMTIGEVLFSVSGMDFAYTEAPVAMKSVMQAANLFTITVGLWLYAILTSVSAATGAFENMPSRESFTYAAFMFADTLFFVVLVKRYYAAKENSAAKYTGAVEKSSYQRTDTNTEKQASADMHSTVGKDNTGYEEDKM